MSNLISREAVLAQLARFTGVPMGLTTSILAIPIVTVVSLGDTHAELDDAYSAQRDFEEDDMAGGPYG